MKTFSIIIPTFNAGKTLKACLAQVHALAYPISHLQTIVVDGGSTDDTLAIAASQKVQVITGYFERPADARNAGAEAAELDYLLFVDADCLLPADLLSHAVEKLLFYDLYGSWTAPHSDEYWIGKTWLSAKKPLNGLQHALSAGALIVSKANFQKIGGFNSGYRADALREFCLHARSLGLNLYHDAHTVSVDMDQPQDLPAFFQREMEHSASKLSLFRDYGLKESSGSIALYLGLFVTAIAVIIGVLGFKLTVLFWVVAAWLLVVLALSLAHAGKVNHALEDETKLHNIWHLSVLYLVSLTAKAVSLIRYHQVDDLLRVDSHQQPKQ
jgi:hypothetical protein